MNNVTKKDIVGALASAGVRSGDIIMVHSSMKAFGHVDGGPEAVVDALLEAVGREGTVIVPTLTATYVKGSASGLAFNAARTPSRVGLVTETLRRRPQAVRSLHPTHSLAAIGPRARELMDGHWPGTTFCLTGPYGKYVKAGAKVVFLGAPITANTTLHAVEDWLDLPYLCEADVRIEKSDGSVETVKVTKAPLDHRDFYSKDGRIHGILEKAGVIKTVRLNDAVIRVMPAKQLVRVTAEAELGFPGVLLCNRVECKFCQDGRRKTLAKQGDVRRNFERLKKDGYMDFS